MDSRPQRTDPSLDTAWIGSQLGCTLWLALLGLDVQLRAHAPVGSALVTLAVLANLLGYGLWKRREHLGRARALRWMVAGTGWIALLALVLLDVTGPSLFELGYLPRLAGVPAWVAALLGGGYPFLVVYPLVYRRLRSQLP